MGKLQSGYKRKHKLFAYTVSGCSRPELFNTDWLAEEGIMNPQVKLDRKSGVALWRQIQQELENRIATGSLGPGERLPTELQMASEFGVNRHTVRRALQNLEEMGLIRVEHGRGAFVQEQVINYTLGKRTRFSEIISKQSRIPGGRLLSSKEIPADTHLAKHLDIPLGSLVLCLETANEVDGKTVSICHHHFPLPRFDGLLDQYKQTGSITESLKLLGVMDYTRKVTRITARMANAQDARYLSQPKSKPVLYVTAINVDPDGVPIEYGATRCASDLIQVVIHSEP
jgi:GntR family phosphonate transport system transcriptional regulator